MKILILISLMLGLQSARAEDVFVEFTLQRGETLSDFSNRVYRTHQKWQQIVEDNKNVITDPNFVPEGTVLRVRNPRVKAANATTTAAAPPNTVASATASPAVVTPTTTTTPTIFPPTQLPAKALVSTTVPVKRSDLKAFTEMELPQ